MNKTELKKLIDNAWLALKIAIDGDLRCELLLDQCLRESLRVEREFRNGRHTEGYRITPTITAKFFVLRETLKGPKEETVEWKDISGYRSDILFSYALHHVLRRRRIFTKAFPNKQFTVIDYIEDICGEQA